MEYIAKKYKSYPISFSIYTLKSKTFIFRRDFHYLSGHEGAAVVMRRPNVHEWSVVSKREQAEAESVQDVDHSGDASVLAEGNNTLPAVVHQLFVVDEANVFLEAGVQQRHVGLLRLDRVREEAVGAVRQQRVHRHLLHAKHHRRITDVLLYHRACRRVRLHGVRATV